MDRSFKACLNLNSLLKGRKVSHVREMNDREMDEEGFKYRPLIIVFEDGFSVYAVHNDLSDGAHLLIKTE